MNSDSSHRLFMTTWVMKLLLHFALIKKKSCSYPSPHLKFIKRHKEWKKGAVLHFTIICCLLEKLRFCLITKQILKRRETARTQEKKSDCHLQRSSISLMCFSLIVLPFSLLSQFLIYGSYFAVIHGIFMIRSICVLVSCKCQRKIVRSCTEQLNQAEHESREQIVTSSMTQL